MAKETKTQTTAPDESALPNLVPGQDIGAVNDDGFVAAGTGENMPNFVPGKNWGVGQALGGVYVRTERVYSPKFKAGKKDPITGKKYRDLHVLEDMSKKTLFGIWSVGILGNFFEQVPPNAPVKLIYKGLGDKPFKEGDNAPHTFETYIGGGYRLQRRAGAAPAASAGARTN